MGISNRLQRLESKLKGEPESLTTYESKQFKCEHPPSAFRLYQDHPPAGYQPRCMITKGHCDSCGFDDYMLEDLGLTQDHHDRRCELNDTGDYHERRTYDLELIAAGLMNYVSFPPPLEIQERFTTNFRS